jgi:hypothetical protein
MNPLTTTIARLRGLDLERALGLRPPYPPVAMEIEPHRLALVRVKRRRRQLPLLEAHAARKLTEDSVPASIFQPVPAASEELAGTLKDLFEASGTRPSRVSLVLPDNLAKISLLRLPERPASRRQLEELVRAKMRRSVPFRLEDASFSYQVMSGESRDVAVLVVLVRRALVERFERPLEALGARVGLVDICTPNLLNLFREQLDSASLAGGDAALLNCARNYFSLVIVREGKLIFFRCKTFALGNESSAGPNGMLVREVSNSFSYYQEKLAGAGIKTILVRDVNPTTDELQARLADLGCESIEPIDLLTRLELGEGLQLDRQACLSIASALGAAAGRGG